jgi:hypothetical protein
MPFAKGQSGNPAGRPRKGKTFTETLHKYLNKKGEDGRKNHDALCETLINLALNGDDKTQIPAIKYIMDRIDGKPAQTVDAQITGNIIDYDKIMKKLEGALLNDYGRV